MHLRLATTADLPVLRHWDRQPHVMSARGEDPAIDWDEELRRQGNGCELLIAESFGRPVGFMEILDPARDEDRYWGDIENGFRCVDIWIGEKADLSQGFGTRMMRLVIEHCFADPLVEAILIDPLVSNESAHRFYERLGFVRLERRLFGDDDCYVYRLDRPPSGRGW
jgi:aminoglycoside 6'-N-acetyltransferase